MQRRILGLNVKYFAGPQRWLVGCGRTVQYFVVHVASTDGCHSATIAHGHTYSLENPIHWLKSKYTLHKPRTMYCHDSLTD